MRARIGGLWRDEDGSGMRFPQRELVNGPEEAARRPNLSKPQRASAVRRQRDRDDRRNRIDHEAPGELRQYWTAEDRSCAALLDHVDRELTRIIPEASFNDLHVDLAHVARTIELHLDPFVSGLLTSAEPPRVQIPVEQVVEPISRLRGRRAHRGDRNFSTLS